MGYSQPEWLSSAVDRLRTYAQSANAGISSLSNMVGLGRIAKGLNIVEPAGADQPEIRLVTDVVGLIALFAPRIGSGVPGGCAEFAEEISRRVRWAGTLPDTRAVNAADVDKARTLFRAYSSFEDMEEFVDFLRDFRHGRAVALAKPVQQRPRDASPALSRVSLAPSVARSVAPSITEQWRTSPSPVRNNRSVVAKKRKRRSSSSDSSKSKSRRRVKGASRS